jgi:hypothetical protein
VDHEKQFIKTFDQLARRHQRARVFEDWVTCASSALIVRSSPQHAEQSEAEYMAVVPRYTREELTTFSELLGLTIMALEARPRDFLGHVFMQAEISNSHMGQFFTPYELSLLTAKLTLEGVDPKQDLITAQEPACGSGGMIIAFCEAAQEMGIDYRWHTYTVAVDLSEVAARMAFIQLSALGIPAHVIWGNTLSMEFKREWPTLGYWNIAHKVARWRRGEVAEKLNPQPDTVTLHRPMVQVELF